MKSILTFCRFNSLCSLASGVILNLLLFPASSLGQTISGTNVMFGPGVGNPTGGANVLIGNVTGNNITSGVANVMLGNEAGYAITNGGYNMFIGNSAGRLTTTGSGNAFFGDGSGYHNATGSGNIAISQYSGFNLTSGNNNVFIGRGSGPNNTAFGGLTNAIAIGYNATVNTDNTMVLGSTGADAVKVGLGISNPVSKLHVTGGGMVLGSTSVTHNTDGFLSMGDITTNSSPNPANWQSGTTLLLNALDYTTVGFHDSGSRVDFIRAGGGTIQLGYDGGWGSANIGMPGGIWNNGGNVGIGTTEPTSRLQVAGAIRATSGAFSSIYSGNTGPSYPSNVVNDLGAAQLSIGANWTSGQSDLSLINSNIRDTDGGGFSFWQMTGAADKKMLAYFRGNGNVGIGTIFPSARLDVSGAFRASAGAFSSIYSDNTGPSYPTNVINSLGAAQLSIGANWTSGLSDLSLINSNLINTDGGGFSFWQMTGAADKRVLAYFQGNGNVGIGTIYPGNYKLAVEGKIGAREVEVKTGSWADFVFAPDYQLRPLDEVASYIKTNSHLPEIPSEAEVKEKGINLGEMNAKLLQKIEELTLYSIESDKANRKQQAEINELKQLVNQLLNKK